MRLDGKEADAYRNAAHALQRRVRAFTEAQFARACRDGDWAGATAALEGVAIPEAEAEPLALDAVG